MQVTSLSSRNRFLNWDADFSVWAWWLFVFYGTRDYMHIKNRIIHTIWGWKCPYLQAKMVSIAPWSKQTFHMHSLHFGISCCYVYSLWIFHPFIIQLRGCSKYRVSTNDHSWSWVHIQLNKWIKMHVFLSSCLADLLN